MECYKDKTYCPFWLLCHKHNECKRALTEEIRQKAYAVGLPICQFAEIPECFEVIWEEEFITGGE